MVNISFLRHHIRLILFVIFFVFSIYSAFIIFHTSQHHEAFDKHFTLLASQFLTKHIALNPYQDLPQGDVANYFNNFYLYFGPFPSIVLMPFVFFFGREFPQVFLGISAMVMSFVTVYFLCKSFKFGKVDSLWLALFFVFSTVLFGSSIINISAYQAQAFGVPLVLLALLEYFTKKRPLVIGIFLGLAVLTRVILLLAVIFFVLEFLQKRLSKKQIMLLLLPVVIACLVFGAYNQRRFHSFFETGYSYALDSISYPLSDNMKYGQISPVHIPANLYSFLIMPPQPFLENQDGFVFKFPYFKVSPWGVAIWYTSPLFLVLLYKFRKSKYTLSTVVTIVCLALPAFLYFSVGFSQYGYRYTLDFLPFLFLFLLSSLSGKLSKTEISLIIVGIIFNCIYITSLWGDYPLFNIYS